MKERWKQGESVEKEEETHYCWGVSPARQAYTLPEIGAVCKVLMSGFIWWLIHGLMLIVEVLCLSELVCLAFGLVENRVGG